MFFCRRLLLAAICISIFSATASAKDSVNTESKWKLSVISGLTLTLNSYSDNWAGSEFSAFSWGAQFNGTAEGKLTEWFTNKYILKLAFGQTSLQKEDDSGEKEWRPLEKSSDLVDVEAIGLFTLKAFIDPFISVRAVTQFGDLRVENHKEFFNPLVVTESFGALRNFIKNDYVNWSGRLGGAVRQSIDRNYHLPDSIKPAETYTNDGGVEFVTDFSAKSKDNRLSFISQVKVYEAILSSTKDKMKDTDAEDYWRYPDISWENTLGVNLAKFIMLNLYAQLLYDREIDKDVRFRETVGLALTYSFAN